MSRSAEVDEIEAPNADEKPLGLPNIKPRRRLRFRQADLERAIRAAQAEGAPRVVVRPDGSIVIELRGGPDGEDMPPSEDGIFPLW